jgi:hypothetical protein
MMRLNGEVSPPQDSEEVFPHQRLASGKAQRANTEITNLAYELNRSSCIHPVIPARLPIVATDAPGLTVFGQFDVGSQRTDG